LTDYGYRISTFTLFGSDKGGGAFTLDYLGLGADGALGIYQRAFEKLALESGTTDSHGHFLSVEGVERIGHCLLVEVKGGQFGEEFEVVDSDNGAPVATVSRADALTWPSRILFVLPQGEAYDGMIVAETRGRSCHVLALNRQLEKLLKHEQLRPEVVNDLADGVAWKAMFQQKKAHVQAVEFRVSDAANDLTHFTEDNSVSGVLVSYALKPDGRAEKKTIEAITGDRPDKASMLLRAVGGERYSELTTEEPVATIVTDGRARRYRVSHQHSRFTRVIESPVRLDNTEFMLEVSPAVVETYAAMAVDVPPGWLPLRQK
jgi:hypothetical protein